MVRHRGEARMARASNGHAREDAERVVGELSRFDWPTSTHLKAARRSAGRHEDGTPRASRLRRWLN